MLFKMAAERKRKNQEKLAKKDENGIQGKKKSLFHKRQVH